MGLMAVLVIYIVLNVFLAIQFISEIVFAVIFWREQRKAGTAVMLGMAVFTFLFLCRNLLIFCRAWF